MPCNRPCAAAPPVPFTRLTTPAGAPLRSRIFISSTPIAGVNSEGFRTAVLPKASAGRSEEHTSELQSLMRISYAVFCLKKQTQQQPIHIDTITHRQPRNDELIVYYIRTNYQ